MSILAIVVIIIGVYLALKVVGVLFKLAFVVLVIAAIYWLVSPYLGMPLPI